MPHFERRAAPRYSLQIPIKFTVTSEEEEPAEFSTKTCNIGELGLLMRSPWRLSIGMPVSLYFQVPSSLSGGQSYVVDCEAEVIHERHLANGGLGYGVKFEAKIPALAVGDEGGDSGATETR